MFDPRSLPQDDAPAAAAQRRACRLSLILDGNSGIRRYAVSADEAWTYRNDPYDHAAGSHETPQSSDVAYYERDSNA